MLYDYFGYEFVVALDILDEFGNVCKSFDLDSFDYEDDALDYAETVPVYHLDEQIVIYVYLDRRCVDWWLVK